jgi:hypothetical protein
LKKEHLVGGAITILKNDGVRQLGWWHSIPNCFWKVIQNSMVPVTTNQILDCVQLANGGLTGIWTFSHGDFRFTTDSVALTGTWCLLKRARRSDSDVAFQDNTRCWYDNHLIAIPLGYNGIYITSSMIWVCLNMFVWKWVWQPICGGFIQLS